MEKQFQKAKVLVVDDEAINEELIAGYLEKDYEVISAYNGKEALEKVRLFNPDIILLDIMMPDMSGNEVCKNVKLRDSTRFIPIIMVTALTEIEHKIKAIESGADDFLTKPINRVELITRIKSLVRTKYYYDELIHQKEQIEAQNEFKTIMTNILPLILQNIPPGKMIEVIGQMSKQVEDVIWAKYIHEIPEEIAQLGNATCNVLNKLGGEFSVKEIRENGYIIINNKCPWGEIGKINPALCMMTKAIFARIGVHAYRNVDVDIRKTLAGKDTCCLIELYVRK